MSEPVEPLALSVRMSDADYPGVLRLLGNGWRLVVSMDGRRYRLQSLWAAADGDVWVCPPSLVAVSLAALCHKGTAFVDGLAQACEGLPDDPAHALPDLVARRDAQLAGIERGRAQARALARDKRAAKVPSRGRRGPDPAKSA